MPQKTRRQVTPRTPLPFAALIARAIDRLDVPPDYTDLYSREDEEAMQTAFIRERLSPEAQRDLESDQCERDREALRQAVMRMRQGIMPEDPVAFATLHNTVADRRSTLRWVTEEIIYALGVEVGRRLSRGAR